MSEQSTKAETKAKTETTKTTAVVAKAETTVAIVGLGKIIATVIAGIGVGVLGTLGYQSLSSKDSTAAAE